MYKISKNYEACKLGDWPVNPCNNFQKTSVIQCIQNNKKFNQQKFCLQQL